MAKIDITTSIKAIINAAIDEITNCELVTNTSARTSHGRTTSSSTTTIRRKPQQQVAKKVEKEEWLIDPQGWEPCKSRRADGLKEHWGALCYNKNGNIDVQVDVVDVQGEEKITVESYTMILTKTVRDQIDACREQARVDVIKGRKPLISSALQKARRLVSHHPFDKRWIEIRNLVNGLYAELNAVAAAAADARTAATSALIKELCKADDQISELMGELNNARRTIERTKVLHSSVHTSDEWIGAITEALAERLGGTKDDIRIARDVAERRLRESDVDED